MLRMGYGAAEHAACRAMVSPVDLRDKSKEPVTISRVFVTNWGTKSVDQVRMCLTGITPGRFDLLPFPLRLMHDTSADFRDSIVGVTVHPGEWRFFDVVTKAEQRGSPYMLCSVLGGLTLLDSEGPTIPKVTLEVSLYARDLDRQHLRFLLDEDEDGTLLFSQVQDRMPSTA